MNERVTSAALLGVSLVVGTMVLGLSAQNFRTASNAISVTGSAQKVITSDRAVWRIGLSRTAGLENITEGSDLIARDLKGLLAYLSSHGVSGSGITVKPVNVETLVNYNVNLPSGYTFRQEVIVTSSDVAALTAVAQGAATLLGKGILVSTTSLEYYYSQLPALRVEMLAEATEDARRRALHIAKSAGATLGHLQAASMGVIQLTAVNSVDVSDYGSYDTSSIEKQITAVVRASFGVR